MKVRLMNKEKLHKKTHENFELHSICAPRQSQKFHAKTFAIIKTRRANSKSMMMISKTSTILFERERKRKELFTALSFVLQRQNPPQGGCSNLSVLKEWEVTKTAWKCLITFKSICAVSDMRATHPCRRKGGSCGVGHIQPYQEGIFMLDLK